MNLENVNAALDASQVKIEEARKLNQYLTYSSVADVLALTLAALDTLHSAVIELTPDVAVPATAQDTTTPLLIVDLYGDGEALRVMADTPANVAAVEAFREADRAYKHSDKTDPPQFTEFVEERGVTLFPTRQLSLEN